MGWKDQIKTSLPKANGKQVAMLLAKAKDKGLGELAFLEWLEFESGLDIEVSEPESILAASVSPIVAKLDAL